jgi:hypothetical protein
VLYRFPKDYSVYGPMQIEARIDMDPEISRALTLWSSSGSQVLRGNLFAIPIEGTILWVEPIYIQAAQDGIPTLQRVAVVYGGRVGSGKADDSRVVMAPTLDEALKLALRAGPPPKPEQAAAAEPAPAQPTGSAAQAQPPETAPQGAPAQGEAEVIRQLAKTLDTWEKRRQQEAEEMRQLRQALEKLAPK